MSYSNRTVNVSFVSATDLSGLQYHIVGNHDENMVDAASPGLALGVLQNKPRSGEHASVAMNGITKVRAGVPVSKGHWIMSLGSGWARNVVSGSAGDKIVIGTALTNAASGSIFSMQIDRFFAVRTGGVL